MRKEKGKQLEERNSSSDLGRVWAVAYAIGVFISVIWPDVIPNQNTIQNYILEHFNGPLRPHDSQTGVHPTSKLHHAPHGNPRTRIYPWLEAPQPTKSLHCCWFPGSCV